MAAPAASRSWLSRDLSRALVLLVWAAFIIAIIINVFDWPAWRAAAVKPQANAAGVKPAFDRDAFYRGAIFFAPEFGDYCWERMLDNRTGNMWDKGYVNCNNSVSELLENKQRGNLSNERMESISKAFTGNGH